MCGATRLQPSARPDLRIANLETAITTASTPAPSGINYRMEPRNAAVLTSFGIDCCALANNHALDWGAEGLLETVSTLKRLSISSAGIGRHLAEAQAHPFRSGSGRRLQL